MRRSAELALIERIRLHQAAGRSTDATAASVKIPTSDYTSISRLEDERALLASAPAVAGLSGLLPSPGCHATVNIGDSPVILTRANDGELSALLNVCRHRGAEVARGCGTAARLVCPYHGWTYDLRGELVSRPRSNYFDDVSGEGLVRLPVAEKNGLIWLSADPDAEIPDRPLQGAETDLAPLSMEKYRLFARTEFTRPINWKLGIDTFCEAYHLRVLHRETLSPMIHSDYALFDAFGLHGRLVSPRRSLDSLLERARDEWALLPHATILWFLVPNAVLIHQQDHIELYQARPGASPDEARLSVQMYVPPDSERSEDHWRRNFDLLVEVTDTEDFATAAGIQRGYYTGAQDHITFGRNEPALQHFHRSLDSMLHAMSRHGKTEPRKG